MPFTEIAPGIFRWADTCNAYVIKDGSAAILIDLGDGSVLDALPQIGVTTVEWVLFTHHHREQCQGFPKLAEAELGGQKVKGTAVLVTEQAGKKTVTDLAAGQ